MASDRGAGGFEVTLSFLVGAATGFVLGILFAPASGEETRKKIQEQASKTGEAAKETYAETSASSASFKKIYDDQLAFKKDSYLWMQVAEYTFDTFMMIQQRSGKL